MISNNKMLFIIIENDIILTNINKYIHFLS